METHALFRLRRSEGVGKYDSKEVLGGIVEWLGKHGIQAAGIQENDQCVYVVCQAKGGKVTVAVQFGPTAQDRAGGRGAVQCVNWLPKWRMALGLYTPEGLSSGEPLAAVCEAIRQIMQNDERFTEAKWMEPDEWKKEFFRLSGKAAR
jgi:hypothetical protein